MKNIPLNEIIFEHEMGTIIQAGNGGNIVVTTIDKITQLAIDESTTNIIKPDSVLIVVRSGILKHTIPAAINDVTVTINQDMKAFKLAIPSPKITQH